MLQIMLHACDIFALKLFFFKYDIETKMITYEA